MWVDEICSSLHSGFIYILNIVPTTTIEVAKTKLGVEWRTDRPGSSYHSCWWLRPWCRSRWPASQSTRAGRRTRLHKRWPWCPCPACCRAASWTPPRPPDAPAWSAPGPTCAWPPPGTEPGRWCRLLCARSQGTRKTWSRTASGSHAIKDTRNTESFFHLQLLAKKKFAAAFLNIKNIKMIKGPEKRYLWKMLYDDWLYRTRWNWVVRAERRKTLAKR